MGIILRGQDCVDGRIVALKTVRSARPADAAGIRREIEALRRVDHPGIVQLYDDGVWSGMPWMAMELLDGQTLCHEIMSLWPYAAGSLFDQRPTTPARGRALRGHDLRVGVAGAGAGRCRAPGRRVLDRRAAVPGAGPPARPRPGAPRPEANERHGRRQRPRHAARLRPRVPRRASRAPRAAAAMSASEPWSTRRPSRSAAKRWTRARTSTPSGACCTRSAPGSARSTATRRTRSPRASCVASRARCRSWWPTCRARSRSWCSRCWPSAPTIAPRRRRRLASVWRASRTGSHGSAYDRLDLSVFTSMHGGGKGRASGRSAN